MFDIRFFNFNKKPNSTAQPTGSGSVFSCNIKTSSSILRPIVEIANVDTFTFNYAYIPAFSRYYYIDDISWSIGYWEVTMHVDVLASFRTDIRNSQQYVLRSASAYNDHIIDTLYPTKVGGHYTSNSYSGNSVRYRKVGSSATTLISDYFNTDITDGYFVVGILGGGSNTSGVTYYGFTNSGYKEFINKITTFTPSNMTDVSSGVANAIWDPVQYITSVRWYPFVDLGTVHQYSINVGGYTIGTLTHGGYVLDVSDQTEFYITINIPSRPSTDAYYLRMSPYSEYSLVMQPLGVIPLDGTKIAGYQSIVVAWFIDMTTGQALFNVWRGTSLTNRDLLLYTTVCDYGVDIPVSTLKMDWKGGLAISALQWIKTNLPDFTSTEPVLNKLIASGDVTQDDLAAAGIKQVNTNLFDSIMDATASALGQLSTSGALGSFLAFLTADPPRIDLYYWDQVGVDNDRYGRPLYDTRTLYNLSGFCLCSNAVVSYSTGKPMTDEQTAVSMLLNSGVYLE